MLFNSNKTEKVISFDMDSRVIKVVQGKHTRFGLKVSKSKSIDIPLGLYENGYVKDVDMLSKEIKMGLKKGKLRYKNAVVAVNSSDIIIKELRIPFVPEDKIINVAKYRLENKLSLSVDEYVYDYETIRIIEGNNVKQIDILLYMVPREIVRTHLSLLSKLKLKPKTMEYKANANLKYIKRLSLLDKNIDMLKSKVVIIDLNYESTSVEISSGYSLNHCRVINVGGKTLINNIAQFFDYTEEESKLKLDEIKDIMDDKQIYTDYYRILNIARSTYVNICKEIQLVINSHLSETSENKIDYLLIKGDYAQLNGLKKLFEIKMETKTLLLSDDLNQINEESRYSTAIGAMTLVSEGKQ